MSNLSFNCESKSDSYKHTKILEVLLWFFLIYSRVKNKTPNKS